MSTDRLSIHGRPQLLQFFDRMAPFVRLTLLCPISLALVLLTLIQLSRATAVILQPAEVLDGEAIIYDHAGRLLRGEPLYQPIEGPPYSVTIYTPLYYWLVAGLRVAFGPGFWPGRLVSLAATLTVACLVGWLAARRTQDRRAGAFAALLFLGLGLPDEEPWSSLYKEDLLGVAFSVAGIAILARGQSTSHVIVAAVFAGLAILTKQTFIAASLAGTIWLMRLNWRKATLFAGVGLTLVVSTCLALEITSGAFLANTVLANAVPFSLDVFRQNLRGLIRFQAAQLVAAAMYVVWYSRRNRRLDDDLLAYFWLASLLSLAGMAKVGSSHNYWLELASITAVLATVQVFLVFKRAPATSSLASNVAIGMLLVHLLWLSPTVALSAPGEIKDVGLDRPNSSELNRLIELVQSEPGEVLATPLDVVALSGRPNLFEPYHYSTMYSQGRWDPVPLVQQICTGGITLVITKPSLAEPSRRYHRVPYWPDPVLEALRATMALEFELAGRFVYRYVGLDARPNAVCGSG